MCCVAYISYSGHPQHEAEAEVSRWWFKFLAENRVEVREAIASTGTEEHHGQFQDTWTHLGGLKVSADALIK